MRFELTASPLPRECATPAPQGQILHFPILSREHLLLKIADDGTRTRNLRFTKPLLYH